MCLLIESPAVLNTILKLSVNANSMYPIWPINDDTPTYGKIMILKCIILKTKKPIASMPFLTHGANG